MDREEGTLHNGILISHKNRRNLGGDQDGRVRGCGAQLAHEHIQNTCTCGIILTEN